MLNGYLWLVPISLLCSSSGYVVLWRALVPWFCRRFLQDRYHLALHVAATPERNGLGRWLCLDGASQAIKI